VGIEDLLGDPFQRLPGPGVSGKGDEPVGELGDAEAFEPAPNRRPRRGRDPRKPIGKEHPLIVSCHR